VSRIFYDKYQKDVYSRHAEKEKSKEQKEELFEFTENPYPLTTRNLPIPLKESSIVKIPSMLRQTDYKIKRATYDINKIIDKLASEEIKLNVTRRIDFGKGTPFLCNIVIKRPVTLHFKYEGYE
jgi:hypothetical protein